MRLTETGRGVELTSSGVTTYSRRQVRELGELYEHVRQAGRGSVEMVAGWLTSSGEPRALHPLLEGELARRGYVLDCPLCQAGADGRRYSAAKARRRFAVNASRAVLLEHRQHARKRPIKPGTTGKRVGLPAPGSVRDGDRRRGEPPFPGIRPEGG
jgi:hypothetical protein